MALLLTVLRHTVAPEKQEPGIRGRVVVSMVTCF